MHLLAQLVEVAFLPKDLPVVGAMIASQARERGYVKVRGDLLRERVHPFDLIRQEQCKADETQQRQLSE